MKCSSDMYIRKQLHFICNFTLNIYVSNDVDVFDKKNYFYIIIILSMAFNLLTTKNQTSINNS